MKPNVTDREIIDIVLIDLRAVRALLTKPEPAIYSFNEDAARRMLTTIVNRLTNHTQPTLGEMTNE